MPVMTLSTGAGLTYGDAGSGPPLILVHGSPGSGRAWARVLQHLPPTMRALTPDLPGYGSSDPLPEGTADRTDAMAVAVGALIEAAPGPVRVCGHSYGGNVALHAALRHRERITGLLLLEPVFMRGLDLADEREVLGRTRAFFTGYADAVAAGTPDAVGTMIDFWCGAGAYARLPPPVQGFLAATAARNVEDVHASFAEAITAAQLAAFDRPVLIAYGGASPPAAPAIATALARLLPRARLAAIDGATHAMLDNHPQDVAALVDGFCRGAAPASPAG